MTGGPPARRARQPRAAPLAVVRLDAGPLPAGRGLAAEPLAKPRGAGSRAAKRPGAGPALSAEGFPAVPRAAPAEEEPGFWGWRLEAACGGLPSSVFFSPDGERGAARRRRERAAKVVCAGCRVRERCADYALSYRERYGVWGGLSEHERAMIWDRQGGRAT